MIRIMTSNLPSKFTPYQVFLVIIIPLILFTIVVDFMLLSALSAMLLPALEVTTREFGLLVSAYAFSAGISAFTAAGYADKFDRKQLLLFFYSGFILGVFLSSLANSYTALFLARIITGCFGGVVASICFAIVTDIFAVRQRGRAMGFVQMAFAGGQILGLPAGLYLATHLHWHLSFAAIFFLGLALLFLVYKKMAPVDQHLLEAKATLPLKHVAKALKNWNYLPVFSNNALIVTGDVALMTFGAAFISNNLNIDLEDLPMIYGVAGVTTFIAAPFVGKITDRYGSFKTFIISTLLMLVVVGVFTNLQAPSLWALIGLHTLLFVGINARMITSASLATVIPKKQERGSFMAVDAALQQAAAGVAAVAAGLIVFQSADGVIQRFPLLGGLVMVVMSITIGLMYRIHRIARSAESHN
jgi:predicted MFS family arabinose efflux permease